MQGEDDRDLVYSVKASEGEDWSCVRQRLDRLLQNAAVAHTPIRIKVWEQKRYEDRQMSLPFLPASGFLGKRDLR